MTGKGDFIFGDNPLKGCLKFRDLPFEKVIDTKYILQTKRYDCINDDFDWDSLYTEDDYESIYHLYEECKNNFDCRIIRLETTVYYPDEDEDDE